MARAVLALRDRFSGYSADLAPSQVPYIGSMDRPPPDPAKLLDAWMEWERGETPPGRVMSTLKTGGLRDLLEEWARRAEAENEAVASGADDGDPSAESWKPLV